MKHHLITAIAVLALLLGLGACTPSPGSSGEPAASGGIPGY